MFLRRPEFAVPILTAEEIVVAIDQLLSDSSGGTPQSRLSSLEWVAARLEERIVAVRDTI